MKNQISTQTVGQMEITTICDDIKKSQFILSPSGSRNEELGGENELNTVDSNISFRSANGSRHFLHSETKKLPKIKILGTGGTIASSGSSASQTAGYKVDLTVQDLLKSIPDISGICEIAYEQLCNVDSKEMNEEILWLIYKTISQDIQKYDGLIVTHGTDTLSETAFFVENTIDSGNVPIVFVGSMRPSSSLGFDGTMNLYQAICIASSEKSKGRGTLVSLNDQISAGFYITKTNANSLDSFNVRQGYLGNFVNNEIHYYYPPCKPLGAGRFKLNLDLNGEPPKSNVFSRVAILYAHQSFNSELIELIVPHYDGLVIATMGAGSLPEALDNYLSKLEIPVIYSKRSMDGMVPIVNVPNSINCIASGYLNPEKSRILLQLCLYSQYSLKEIRESFNGVYGG
ncbi:L-asparaginase 1 [Hanseniaspora osmophila]